LGKYAGQGRPEKPEYSSKIKPKAANEGQIRLNKYISNSGICSRREADEMISQGLVSVNGTVVSEMGYKVNQGDEVKVDGSVIKPEPNVYVLLNKPKDFITTTEDPENRRTVMNLVASACKERIYPVGRLDRNTTGLLLLTNDGELAEKLSHPSAKMKKVYQVTLDKPLTRSDFEEVLNGVRLEDGPAPVDELAYVGDDKRVIGIELHVGRNRIVRRIFEHLGYKVMYLDRVMYAGLTKKDLPRGTWRYLNEREVIQLKHLKI
jgi:23S rRNA pseudouridine2605 synthase